MNYNMSEVKCFFEFYEKGFKNIWFLFNLLRCNLLIVWKRKITPSGGLLMCISFVVTIHDELVNGLSMIIICNDESIY